MLLIFIMAIFKSNLSKDKLSGPWARVILSNRVRMPIHARYSGTTSWYPHNLRARHAKGFDLILKIKTNPIIIGCFVPKHPDTLNPNGISIIQSEGLQASIAFHVEPAPFRGAYAINQFSLSSCEGSRRLRLLPLTLPICIIS